MIIAASLKQLLDSYKITYRILQHKRVAALESAVRILKVDRHCTLTIQVLADSEGVLLMIYPLTRKIDFAACKALLNRDLKVLPSIRVNRMFNDCEANCWPAIGQAYNFETIIDSSIEQLEHVYIASGSHTAVLQLQAADFFHLHPRAKILAFTTPNSKEFAVPLLTEPHNHHQSYAPATLVFPDLPPIAWQILQLAASKEHATKELEELIAKDSIISQQIGLYMQLPFVQGHILGFDMVSHIALGVAAGRAFSTERIAGIEDFWRHAFYTATYAQRLTTLIAADQQPNLILDPAISYLAGIFHNFGLLLFSQLFPPEYALLKKWLRLNPRTSIAVLEKRLLGMGQAFDIVRGGHAQLGEWLLRHWRLPEVICVITKEHHSLTYKGKYVQYVRIIQLANQLLRMDGIGDGSVGGINEYLLEPLGLQLAQVKECIQQIKTGAESLDKMARFLTS